MSAQPNLLHVQLSQLQLSPLNARKTGVVDVEGLAASIEAHGLMQNLSVTPSANDPDRFDVIAGGRRLAALQRLQQEGRLDPHYLVPIRLIADDAALEASTAENTMREAMHPADQFDAFKGMVEAKKSIGDIAAHFGVPEIFVKQRLKLAKVAPKLVQVYREEGMSLEQLQTLALTDDQKLQEKVWFGAKSNYDRGAGRLRQQLTESKVASTNHVARFVGLPAYEAAGGLVLRDLFSTRDEAFLTDRQLLDTLAMDKLEAAAQRERDEGWSWVVARISADYDQLAEYPHSGAEPKFAKPGAEENSRIKDINARLKEIEVLIDADDEAEGDDQLEWEDREALTDESEALEQERRNLSGGKEIWPDAIKAVAGVVVFLDNGGLRVARGRLQPGQKADKAGAVTGKPTEASGTKPAAPKKPELSQDMVLRLEMHRAAAIRMHVASEPRKAFTLLLTNLALDLLHAGRGASLGLSLNPRNNHAAADGLIKSKFADLGKAPARKALDLIVGNWKNAGMPTKAVELFTWVDQLPDDKRLELLAVATALTLDTNSGDRGKALAEVFNVNMQTWWEATPASYLELVPKVLLAEAVADVTGKPAGESVLAMKKDGAMAEAAKRLAGTGWLPKPLRGPAYKLGKAAAAKPAPAASKPAKKAAAPAKKPAAKKQAKKAAKRAPKKGAVK